MRISLLAGRLAGLTADGTISIGACEPESVSGPHIEFPTQSLSMEGSQNSLLGSREKVRDLVGRTSL